MLRNSVFNRFTRLTNVIKGTFCTSNNINKFDGFTIRIIFKEKSYIIIEYFTVVP